MSSFAFSQMKVWCEAGLSVAAQKDLRHGKKPRGIFVESWTHTMLRVGGRVMVVQATSKSSSAKEVYVKEGGARLHKEVLIVQQSHECRLGAIHVADELHYAGCSESSTCQ